MKSENENPSSEQVEMLVLRRLRGELGAADSARLEAALGRDPKLAQAAALLERTWSGLELPPYQAASAAPQILARLRAERASAIPGWARLAAAAALFAGIGAGLGFDLGLEPPADEPAIVQNDGDDLFADEEGLAESLWLAADDWQDDGEIQ